MSDLTWTRLEEGNDWDTLYYTPVGERLDSGGMASHSRGVRLEVGKWYMCRFPTGAEMVCQLVQDKRRLKLSRGFEGTDWCTSLTRNVEIALNEHELNREGRSESE